MSKDTIYREDAIKAINLRARIPHDIASAHYASMAINAICSVPSADRPQGEWIYTMNPLRLNDEWECSKCGYLSFAKANYCGHCGARMLKGADDE